MVTVGIRALELEYLVKILELKLELKIPSDSDST
jgi:hypothetical protein